MSTEFKKGDIVEAFGCEGEVVSDNGNTHFPLEVRVTIPENDSGCICLSFTKDGKWVPWAKEPSLKLISRPKRKEKRVVEMWVNVSVDGYYRFWDTEAKALGDTCSTDTVVAVKLTGEYEVEVEG